jgi:hypothetical protein
VGWSTHARHGYPHLVYNILQNWESYAFSEPKVLVGKINEELHDGRLFNFKAGLRKDVDLKVF